MNVSRVPRLRLVPMSTPVPPDALVIRFRPTDPESVLRRAEVSARLDGRYLLSVFADAPTAGESEIDLRARLLKASEMSGLPADKNKKYYVCTRAKELLDRGFAFCKDGDDDELDEHYSVDLGSSPTLGDVCRFLEAFGPAEMR